MVNQSVVLALLGIGVIAILLDVSPKLGGWFLLLLVIVMLVNAQKRHVI